MRHWDTFCFWTNHSICSIQVSLHVSLADGFFIFFLLFSAGSDSSRKKQWLHNESVLTLGHRRFLLSSSSSILILPKLLWSIWSVEHHVTNSWLSLMENDCLLIMITLNFHQQAVCPLLSWTPTSWFLPKARASDAATQKANTKTCCFNSKNPSCNVGVLRCILITRPAGCLCGCWDSSAAAWPCVAFFCLKIRACLFQFCFSFQKMLFSPNKFHEPLHLIFKVFTPQRQRLCSFMKPIAANCNKPCGSNSFCIRLCAWCPWQHLRV